MADRAGVALEVSLPRLYHGYTSAIMTELADGRLGELTYCRVRLSHDGAIAGWLPDRFYDPTAAVGGALSDLGCHRAAAASWTLISGATAPTTTSSTFRR
jgi:1,5-anhydro-D-fructose reductase (1,5-anhydro-D-mannitol-forming)